MTAKGSTLVRWKVLRLIMALCLLACARTVYALAAQPSYQMFTLKPGDRTTATVTLSNDEDIDLNITPTVKDWFTTQANKKIKTADWLKMDMKPFVLKKGEHKTIKFTAQAPKNATGEVMGMMTFTTKPITDSMISFRLSLAVYVAIEGTEKKEGEVAAISVSVSSDTAVSYLFANRGNVHLRPKGLIKIFDDKDQQLLNVVYEQTVPTYPGTKQAYTTRIRNFQLEPGRYRAEINFEEGDWNMSYPPEKKKFVYKANGKIEAQ